MLIFFANERFESLHPRGLAGRFLSKEFLVNAVTEKVDLAIQRDGIPPEMAALYRETLAGVFRSMSTGGMKRLHDRVASWNFRPSISALMAAHRQVGGENDGGRKIGGFLVERPDGKADLYLDGGQDTGQNYKNVTAHTYRHEMAHILDGTSEPRISSGDAWKKAWRTEIDNYQSVPLTMHAIMDAREGFAEFGRLVLTDRKSARKKFPLCWAVWRDHHLV